MWVSKWNLSHYWCLNEILWAFIRLYKGAILAKEKMRVENCDLSKGHTKCSLLTQKKTICEKCVRHWSSSFGPKCLKAPGWYATSGMKYEKTLASVLGGFFQNGFCVQTENGDLKMPKTQPKKNYMVSLPRFLLWFILGRTSLQLDTKMTPKDSRRPGQRSTL